MFAKKKWVYHFGAVRPAKVGDGVESAKESQIKSIRTIKMTGITNTWWFEAYH